MKSVIEVLLDLWNYVISLILPSDSDACGTKVVDPPSAAVFLSNLQPYQIVFLAVATPLSFAIFGLAIFQWYNVWTHISSEERRNNLYFLISLLPVSTYCCLFGMYFPRAAVLLSSIGLLYFLMCLFILVSLIHHLSQGRRVLSRNLIDRGKFINFQSPPFCCCMPFLPKANPTECNLKRLEWIVLQAPIVRGFILFGQVIAVAEQRENAIKLLHIFDLSSSVSLLLAIFGIHTLARLTSNQLSYFGFIGIFRLIDIALLFFSAQQPLLFQNIFLRFGVIHCGPLLSSQDSARFICNFVIVCELFLLSLCSTFVMSPQRNNLFDKYHDKFGVTSEPMTSEFSNLTLAAHPSEQQPSSNVNNNNNSQALTSVESHSVCTQMTLLCDQNE